jgi:hypothetical protein
MRLGERGIHIQRWLEPPQVFRRKKSVALLKYEKALKHQDDTSGTRSRRLDAIAIHGRFATCARTLQNTHPFYRNGAALMHNGIITNASQYDHPLSTCDSEALLTQYLAHDVRASQAKLGGALDGVGGYYAAIVFNDNGVIDIWRDDHASLCMAHVQGVGVVIATTADIIVSTARKCKAYITGIDEILPFTQIRWTRGVSPQIATFEARKPLTVLKPEVLPADHAGGYTPSEYGKKHPAHWWQEDDYDRREAQRIAQWEHEEEQDRLALERLQNTIDGRGN